MMQQGSHLLLKKIAAKLVSPFRLTPLYVDVGEDQEDEQGSHLLGDGCDCIGHNHFRLVGKRNQINTLVCLRRRRPKE